MSRSYKKNPIIRDKNPGMKKILRRKLRRSLLDNDNLPQNGDYRRMTEKWDFCDFAFECDWKEFQSHNPEEDVEQLYHRWWTVYKMK